MKLSFILLVLTLVQVNATGYGQKVTLKSRNLSVESLFKVIEKQTGYSFFYDHNDLKGIRVSIDVKESDLIDVLEQCFAQVPLTYKVIGKTIAIKPQRASRQSLEVEPVHLQEIQNLSTEMIKKSSKVLSLHLQSLVAFKVVGEVVNEQNEGLPGVNIIVKNSQIGTSTNVDGGYSLDVANETVTLLFSSIGYLTQEVSVNGKSTLNVTLKQDDKLLEEVVVVGYGVQQKKDITGAISSVKSEELLQTPIVNIAQGIQARVPGVQITQNSSAPGGNISVRIRGTNSINGSSEPLYVVDGIQITNEGNITDISPLSTINPNDIESVEILKDASATAIYGSRGSNGVIIITTKRGKNSPTKIQFDSYVGTQQITKKLDVLNARDFAALENDTYPEKPYPNLDQVGEGINWQDLVYRKATIQNYQLSMQGGNSKTRFSMSGNYFNQDGIIIKSNFSRYSLRMTLDHEVKKGLKVGTTILGSYSANKGIPTGNTGVSAANSMNSIVGTALSAPPTLKPYREDGSLFPFVDQGGGRYAEVVNPLTLAEVHNFTGTNRVLANLFIEKEFLKDFKYKASFNADINNSLNDYYSPIYIIPESMRNASSGTAIKNNNYGRSLLHESILTWNKSLGDHTIKFTGVYAVQTTSASMNNISAFGFPNDQTRNEAVNLAASYTVNSSRQKQDMASVMGRVNYSYLEKYYIDVTGRYDGASKFGANHKYGFFPAISGAWRIIKEGFMQDQQFFSDLKLRFSYGITGNAAAIGPYQSLSLASKRGSYYFDHLYKVGISPSGIANTDLRWEKSKQSNFGLEAAFFNDRLSLVVDVYNKKTDDLLFGRDLPLSSGYSSYTGNFAVLRNKGVEIGVNSAILEKELKWTLGGNVSFNRNEILALQGDKQEYITSEFTVLKVGQPVGVFRTYVFDGIYQTGESILSGQTSRVGGTRLKDLNGDGRITAEDQRIVGNPNPDAIWGLTSNMSYKGFDLSLLFSGVIGNEAYNLSRYNLENPMGSRNVLAELVNRWSPTNPSNEYQNPSQGGRLPVSDRFVEDGSFIRLKNLNLGYTAYDLLGISSVRFYVSLNNLFTWTKYTGYDPEVNSYGGSNVMLGVDNLVYPNAKSYLGGIQVNF